MTKCFRCSSQPATELLTSILILMFLGGGVVAPDAFANPPRPGGAEAPQKPGKPKLPRKRK